MDRKRDIDIIKGFAIIMMVYGHTFGVARDFIYLFHMPVFIFVSGYCFNAAHADSLTATGNYWLGRVKRLLLPYMGFNILFVLCHNLFLRLNLYSDRFEFKLAVNPIQLAAQTLMAHKSHKELLKSVIDVILLRDIPQMGSATWFLVVLFDVCIIHCLLAFLIGKIKSDIVKKVVWTLLFVGCLIIAYTISEGRVDTEKYEMRHLQIFEVYSCYLMGVFAREYSHLLPLEKKTAVSIAGLSSLVILYSVMLSFGTLEMSKCYIIHPVFLILVTVLGMVMLEGFAVDLENNKLGGALAYIGKHTMTILFLHILAFKLVSIFYCIATATPMYMVASWPVLFGVSEWVKIAYTIVGVAVPVFIDLIVEKLKGGAL
jgi:fucose 4-O-acetylase-like acetyltransferase